ncbi:hypothetical protein [Brunnivagina elsteri]|nr:hypothetical protein [Calothrix elsteri]
MINSSDQSTPINPTPTPATTSDIEITEIITVALQQGGVYAD